MQASYWSALGDVLPRELTETRLLLHYAAQPMTAAAYAALPMRADHSHTNLFWSTAPRGFVGRPLPGGHRCFLDASALRTGLLDPGGTIVEAVDLAGQTLSAALAAMTAALRRAGEDTLSEALRLPEYDLPETDVSRGGAFSAPEARAAAELERWFENGASVLGPLTTAMLEGAELRIWPHHFDMAALLTIDANEDAESARSVGAGMSPGDGSYSEPYFYVTPWPAPSSGDLPELSGGARWHTDGFTAAVLTGTALVQFDSSDAQQATTAEALRSAVTTCVGLLAR